MQQNNNNNENTANTSGTELFSELEKTTETKSASSEVLPKFNFGTEEETPKATVDPKPTTPENTPETTKPGAKKLTKEDFQLSGETAAASLDTMTNFLFTLGLKLQTKYKFTEEQREIIDTTDILDRKDSDLSEEHLKLKNFWERTMKSQRRKFEKLEASSDEQSEARRAKILTKYFEATNTEIGPGWMLIMALIEDIGGKAEAIFLEV
ncbi:MAG: hypothetical protein K0R26_1916 [Bacteroidota bacterium]|jgi:hypothetical protein|nr:hypothetical protein [Bacteroidota bacterium]